MVFLKLNYVLLISEYDVKRMEWFCNWRWHTVHCDDEDRAFYKKLTPETLRRGEIVSGYNTCLLAINSI